VPRAYTRIGNGTVVVGNDWVERSWSEFLCRTMELRQRVSGGYVEWIASPAADLRLELDGVPLHPEMIGPPEWSESCNSLGATVSVRWTGPGWVVAAHTTALHENPALVRSMEIANVGGQSFRMTAVAVDVLALRRDGAGVLTHDLARRSASATWESDGCAAVELQGHGRLGLLFGLEGGGQFELFEPDPAFCALSVRGTVELPPGKTVRLPRSFMIPYSGDADVAVSGRWAEMLRMLREHGRREQEQAADTA